MQLVRSLTGWVISEATAHLLSKAIICYLIKKTPNPLSIAKASEEMSALSFADFIKIILKEALIRMIKSNKLSGKRSYAGPI